MSRRILIIDDEPGLRHTLTLLLRDEGFDVVSAGDGEAGLQAAVAESPDLILCDIRMPRLGGLEFLARYREASGDALVIMMSAYGTLDTALEAMRQGAYDYVSKPFNADEVILTLRKAEERENLRREVRRLRERIGEPEGFEEVIAESSAMREAIALKVPSLVLIGLATACSWRPTAALFSLTKLANCSSRCR